MTETKRKETELWIIPQEWEIISLDKLLNFVVDNRWKTVPTSDSGIPLIATNCIKHDWLYPIYDKIRYISQETYDTRFRAHPQEWDIIFVNKGTPWMTCLVPKDHDFCIAQDMVALRVNSEIIDNKYLFAYMRSKSFADYIKNMTVWCVIPHLKKSDFGKILIPYPTKEEQKFIGNFYFDIWSEIELLNKQKQTLEDIEKTIFKEWFIDFNYPLTDGKFKDSDLGKIPKEWQVKKIWEIAKFSQWIQVPLEKQNEFRYSNSIRFVRIKDYMNSSEPPRYIDQVDQRYIASKNDIVMVRYWEIWLIWEGIEWAIANNLFKIEPIKGMTVNYLKTYLQQDSIKWMIKNSSTWSALPAITHDTIKNIEIIIPQDDLLIKYERIIQVLKNKKFYNNEQIEFLTQTRDALLPRLMNGKVRVI